MSVVASFTRAHYDVLLAVRQPQPDYGEEVLVDSGEAFVFHRLAMQDLAAALRDRHDCIVLEGLREDVLPALQAIRHAGHETPVIVLGHDDLGWGLEAFDQGAQDVLEGATVDAALLARSIRYGVQRQRAELSARELREGRLQQAEQARLERGLIPVPLLRSGDVRCGAAYRAGGRRRLLGGDFFDVVELADGSVRVVIGDVCGHGPDEAALGVALRVAWRSLVLAGAEPDATLAALDTVFAAERHRPGFATVCDATIAPDRRSLEVRLAGHPPPLLLAGPALEAGTAPAGPPLGSQRRTTPIPMSRWILPEAWTMLFYTDGLFEVRQRDGDRLWPEGLGELAAQLAPAWGDLDGWAAKVVAEVEALADAPLTDDIALLVVAYRATP